MIILYSNSCTIGFGPSNPAVSCAEILDTTPAAPSGDYWLQPSNDSPVEVLCDMTLSCSGITGEWLQVVKLDTTDLTCSTFVWTRLCQPWLLFTSI